MLALIAGSDVGVMPYGVEPIMIRVPRRLKVRDPDQQGSGATFEDWLEGISRVGDSMSGKSSEAKAIMLLSLYFPASEWNANGQVATPENPNIRHPKGFAKRMRALLADAISKGVLPITGSGNSESVGVFLPRLCH